MKWKPLIASLVVIVVALAAMALWSKLSGPKQPRTNSAPANSTHTDGGTDSGVKYDITPLEDLPKLDPLGLWPRHDQRMPAADIWIMWETNGHTKCRLLGTKDHRDWYVLGHTSGEKHFMEVNLALFDSALTFAVEFEANGSRYRSAPRTVVFGKGASFGQRRYKYNLGSASSPTWELELTGQDATQLSGEAFLTGWFGDDAGAFATAKSADTVIFGLSDAASLKSGTTGFLEVNDERNRTSDRVPIELKR